MQRLIYITDESIIGYTRRELKQLCDEYGYETVKENASIVVTELASNGIKHAKDSCILLKPIDKGKARGIEIVYLDKGPGLEIEKVQKDGFSTAGSLGVGLGAIKRLSSECHLYSQHGKGTCIVCRLYEKSTTPPLAVKNLLSLEKFEYSYICLPVSGEEHCGDDVALYICKDYALVFVADGLGHGDFANQAVVKAKEIFYENTDKEPAAIIEKIDKALYSTRGAAVSIAKIIPVEQKVVYSGVGNISGAIIGQKRVNMVSHNGTLGMGNNKVQTFVYPWQKNNVLIMHSDGVSSKWSFEEYPDVLGKDLSIIGGVIFRGYHRPKDDAAILVVKEV